MKTITTCLTILFFGGSIIAAEPPAIPQPVKEHAWLQQLTGEWESEVAITLDPAQPPTKSKFTEVARMLGGFWIVVEGKGEMAGAPFHSVLTLGFDPEKKKYIGTWLDSMSSHLWQYEGTVDATGMKLTLETEGPDMMNGGRITKTRDVLELKSKDHRVLTSSSQQADGTWRTNVTMTSRRTK